MGGTQCARGRSDKVREKQELDHVGCWQPQRSSDFFLESVGSH